ncbi:alpha-galactosidase [Candidatus Enterococcus ferrettii]|uniref:Alpha-galactosidase n=1 Tax=Candidatus Enterococcus ferrettii TaxID=2815324 RepID=A0ABV0EUL6_9ENTE|nr:alpha-galactosidase [Enterococcus sp. 665A]MBO1342370.1 alpha-galactosidase [Enterococcus sp. 665A]
MVELLDNQRTFHIQVKHTSLVLHVLPTGHVTVIYWGKRLESKSLAYVIQDIGRASYISDTDGIKDFKLEQLPQAMPTHGNSDLRTPALVLEYADGSRITNLRYKDFKVYSGKERLPGMPTITSGEEVETVEILLEDYLQQVTVKLIFSAFYEYNAITQSVVVTNLSKSNVTIEKVVSSNIDFLDAAYDVCYLSGAWGRETHRQVRPLSQGAFLLDSKRGASGHGQNPFLALADKQANENSGSIYSMNMVYSGNFQAIAEVDMHQNTRMQMGINPFDFAWQLVPQESFYTPETVLIYSDQGYNQLSAIYHRFYRECLMKSSHAEKVRPVLINNWEATYFDFDKRKLLSLAKEAADCGIELFVLDDGWFGKRSDTTTSLGDWQPNHQKLGGSLSGLIEEIGQLGLQFGLWVEPEMVSPDSELYRAHPDWIIQVAGRDPQLARHQYVLDLANPAVQNYLITELSTLLEKENIAYIKWDMNRNITDSGSSYLAVAQQKELSHRYILGLYHVLEILTEQFPEVLFESCAGGGGRYDPGMLYYMPQTWTSDDTDAIERLPIQSGTSLIYPPISMGCHVSAVPNHQVGRITSMDTRGIVAMQGNLGYELDLTQLSTEEKLLVKEQVVQYKEIREIVQLGQLIRLTEIENQNQYAWLYRSKDATAFVVSFVQVLARANTVPKRLKLAGLDAKAYYQVGERICTGSELMSIGLKLDKPIEDYAGQRWLVKKIEK